MPDVELKTIWKFPLSLGERQTIAMPPDAEILTVQLQDDEPMLWAIVPARTTRRRNVLFYCLGTGREWLSGGMRYIGTIQRDGCVWHYFVREEGPL